MKIALVSDTHGVCRKNYLTISKIVIISFTPEILTMNVPITDS